MDKLIGIIFLLGYVLLSTTLFILLIHLFNLAFNSEVASYVK